jgi:nitroreductase
MEKKAETAHPVHELIERRWSPRAFDPRPVPAEDLRSLFEAARWAASSFNEQPWVFLVARREDGEAHARMLECLMEGNRSWAKEAGALVLTFSKKTFSRNGRPNRCALHDLGQAAAHLALEATARGLFVHQMAGIELDRIRELHGVPEEYEPQTAMAIGYPGRAEDLPESLREMEAAPRGRREQSEFVFSGAWGRSTDW